MDKDLHMNQSSGTSKETLIAHELQKLVKSQEVKNVEILNPSDFSQKCVEQWRWTICLSVAKTDIMFLQKSCRQ